MITAVDTNIIVALWDKDPRLSSAAQAALDNALARGGLAISAPVLAELMAAPGRSEKFIDSFLQNTGLAVDWNLDQRIWRTAGRAFQKYAARRRNQSGLGPRRILADFLIGAHAAVLDYPLLTLDDRLYHAAFPRLVLLGV
jgi:predicted nucleic acid-binding protein